MKTRYTHRVIRVATGNNNGDHKSYAAAEKRIKRLVTMSNGKLTATDFKIEEIHV